MLQLIVTVTLFVAVQAQFKRPPLPFGRPQFPIPFPQPLQPTSFRLCSYTDLANEKCNYAVGVAANASIELPLNCVQAASFDGCLQAIRSRTADLVVASEHYYRAARTRGLMPLLYARENRTSLYIAVAPRNITLMGLYEAALEVNQTDERAFHAAAYFNLRRGHDICRSNAQEETTIRIIDSAEYAPTDDEILVCPDRTYAEFTDYRVCNVEASLERAIFSAPLLHRFTYNVQRIFNTLLSQLGPNNSEWNFFDTFEDVDDVILKNNTIGFSVKPEYLNGVNEKIFNLLHCNTEGQEHNPNELE